MVEKFIDLKELRELPGEFIQTFNPQNMLAKGYPWFTLRGDGSAFCALFMDNLATQMSLAGMAMGFGMPAEFVWTHFFGGVGLSIFVGNLYYTLQASKIAKRTGKMDTCAQPYGINTPGAIAKTFGILLPVYLTNGGDAQRAWETACVGNFFGGLFEFLGAFIAPVIAKNVPQPAFMAPIGGIGMVWLGISALIDMLGSHTAHNPMAGFVPFVIMWVAFFGSPERGLFGNFVPAAFVALVVGMILCYIAMTDNWTAFTDRVDKSTDFLKWNGLAVPGWGYVDDAMGEYGGLILGLALTNFIGTYACNISARKGGDLFPVMESMMVDGLGSMLGALFGSPYGTTVYIGHVAYKKMGATRGYSLLNGVIWLIFGLFGFHAVIDAILPHEIVLGILIVVGFSMSAQVVACSPKRWYPAVLVGMALCFADYIGNESQDKDVKLLQNGYVIICLMYTLALIMLTDRWFLAAAGTFVTLSIFSLFGIIHAVKINIKYTDKGTVQGSEAMFETDGLPGWKLIVTYLLCAVLCIGFYLAQKANLVEPPEQEDFRVLQAKEFEELAQEGAQDGGKKETENPTLKEEEVGV